MRLGDLAPDFSLSGIDHRTYRLESFSDKPVLVVIFSCNHCPYVQAYEDRMIEIQHDYEAKGVQLIAVNSNDDVNYPEDGFEEMILRAQSIGFHLIVHPIACVVGSAGSLFWRRASSASLRYLRVTA